MFDSAQKTSAGPETKQNFNQNTKSPIENNTNGGLSSHDDSKLATAGTQSQKRAEADTSAPDLR